MTTMEYQTPTSNDQEAPRPAAKQRKSLPKMHLDPVHGPDLVGELLQHVEALRAESREALGTGSRILLNRAWKVELFANEIAAHHELGGE